MFNGDRLRVARQRRALTKKSLAASLDVTPRTITGWEADEYPPEEDNLRALAELLKFPVGFFSLDDSDKTKTDAVSFRSLSSKTAGQRDATLAMCDIAKDFAIWLEDKFNLPMVDVPDLRHESPRTAAMILRHQWGLGNKPIRNLLHLLEAKGIRVFALSENCREIDACSFWSNYTPFIMQNTTVNNERARFDLAHELGHLVLHRDAAPSGRQAENEANQFAAEFLMPEDSVRSIIVRYWSMEALIDKKKVWTVSLAALAYRLHKLGLISDWHFKSLNIEMVNRGYKKDEPNPSPKEQSKVLQVVADRLREIGMPFSYIANQMCIPEAEVKGFFDGMTLIPVEGKSGSVVNGGMSHLRVVQ
ncbi:MAG: ImmA/IrrE family metallo-endopeptidase [Porticoccaceae bacterium]|uniref:ImmA/IrrE family metallo-endopeptidase n=1 Tax=Thalassospira sp. TaxID=1912094 RepID=UPI003A83CFC3